MWRAQAEPESKDWNKADLGVEVGGGGRRGKGGGGWRQGGNEENEVKRGRDPFIHSLTK